MPGSAVPFSPIDRSGFLVSLTDPQSKKHPGQIINLFCIDTQKHMQAEIMAVLKFKFFCQSIFVWIDGVCESINAREFQEITNYPIAALWDFPQVTTPNSYSANFFVTKTPTAL